MNRIESKYKHVVHFARWSRKNYALFAAIGKQVRITSLALRMCQSAFLKAAKQGVIINNDSACTRELAKNRGQRIALFFGSIATATGVLYSIVLKYRTEPLIP
ncbi:MAG: hypothetical protein ACRDDZ_10470 [Marinifilaceae bacterium]